MLRKEWKIFLTALMFLTRIRVPASVDHHPDYLQKSPAYFPVVGWIVGGISAAVLVSMNSFLSAGIAVLASMIAGILTTGAFHEDGFADVCDGFGGGWTREKILLIMKDSRIGAFGAIGLIAMLSAKFLLLRDWLGQCKASASAGVFPHAGELVTGPRAFLTTSPLIVLAASLLAAHGLSRLMPVLVMRFFDYAADPDTSKSKPLANQQPGSGSLVFATLTALLPFIFLPRPFLFALFPVVCAAYWMARYFKKWIGGYTGDCLGSIQQVAEIVCYASFLLVGKYGAM